MKNKILIIEPNSTGGINLLESARRMNVETHIVTHKELYDEYDSKIKGMIDYPFFTDFTNRENAISDIVNYSKENNIEAVLAGFEFMTDIVVETCEKLNLPSHDVEKAAGLRRKDLMHSYFKEQNVPCAETIVVKDWEQCEIAANEIGYPVIIKPSSNAGSCGVFKVSNTEELNNAFNYIRANNTEFPHNIPLCENILIQEFLEGSEYSIELAISEGNVHLLAITDKMTTDYRTFAEIGHTLPTRLDSKEQKSILDVTAKAIKALGLKNGIAHVEAKVTSNGVKIIEVGARMPGDRIPDLLLKAQDIDEGKIYIDIALGKGYSAIHSTKRYAGIRFLSTNKNGRFKGIEGLDFINKEFNDNNLEVDIYCSIGENIKVPTDNIDRVGHILYVGESYEDVFNKCNYIKNNIKVLVD